MIMGVLITQSIFDESKSSFTYHEHQVELEDFMTSLPGSHIIDVVLKGEVAALHSIPVQQGFRGQ